MASLILLSRIKYTKLRVYTHAHAHTHTHAHTRVIEAVFIETEMSNA